MRVGFRTLFPTSPPENDRWTVEVVSRRALLLNRVRDWFGPTYPSRIVGFAALTVRALTTGGVWNILWVVLGVAAIAPVQVVWERQRRARISSAVEQDSRKHIAYGIARARAIEMLQASAYVRKNRPAAQAPLIEVHLFLGEGGAIDMAERSRSLCG